MVNKQNNKNTVAQENNPEEHPYAQMLRDKGFKDEEIPTDWSDCFLTVSRW